MPFALKSRLREKSGDAGLFQKANELYASKIVVSGKRDRLITGQNPASSAAIGDAILKAPSNQHYSRALSSYIVLHTVH